MKVTDEELQALDDHILAVQQMSFSLFEGAVAELEAKLRLSAEVLDEWIQLQMWVSAPLCAAHDRDPPTSGPNRRRQFLTSASLVLTGSGCTWSPSSAARISHASCRPR